MNIPEQKMLSIENCNNPISVVWEWKALQTTLIFVCAQLQDFYLTTVLLSRAKEPTQQVLLAPQGYSSLSS